MSYREERDKQTQTKVNIVGGRLTGRLWEVHAMTAKEGVEGVLAIKNEVGDRTVEQSHEQSKHQVGEIGNHSLSLAMPARLPIRRRT